MSVIIEFTLPSDSFPFGRSMSGDPDVRVQLERVVPLRQARIPFVWATGESFDRFEDHLTDSPIVKSVDVLTRVGDSVLYAIEWYESEEAFLNGVSDRSGVILEAHGNETFSFTIRFADHADLTRFHHFYQEEEYPVHIDRVYSLDDEPHNEYGLGLTPEQRDALTLAVEKGYFAVPRETTLDEMAEELGITGQAASERVRRGTETVLRKSMIGLVGADFGPPDGESAGEDPVAERPEDGE